MSRQPSDADLADVIKMVQAGDKLAITIAQTLIDEHIDRSAAVYALGKVFALLLLDAECSTCEGDRTELVTTEHRLALFEADVQDHLVNMRAMKTPTSSVM